MTDKKFDSRRAVFSGLGGECLPKRPDVLPLYDGVLMDDASAGTQKKRTTGREDLPKH